MKFRYLFLVMLCAVEMCCAIPEKINNVVKQYDGSDLTTLDLEMLKQNMDTLCDLSEKQEWREKASLIYAYTISMETPSKNHVLENLYAVLGLRSKCKDYVGHWGKVLDIILNDLAKLYVVPLNSVQNILKNDLKGPSEWNWDECDLNEYREHLATIRKSLETCKDRIPACVSQ